MYRKKLQYNENNLAGIFLNQHVYNSQYENNHKNIGHLLSFRQSLTKNSNVRSDNYEMLTSKMVLILKIKGSSSPPLFRALVLLTSSGEVRVWVEECIVNEYTFRCNKKCSPTNGSCELPPGFYNFQSEKFPHSRVSLTLSLSRLVSGSSVLCTHFTTSLLQPFCIYSRSV